MHIPPSYIGTTSVSELTGYLSLPSLKSSSTGGKDLEFIEELNREGAYIHKLSTDQNSLPDQLKKIRDNRIPTPATFVGVGMHRVYDHWRWKHTSGLVFSPESISLLSYKGDIASLRLTAGKTFQDFVKGKKIDRYEAYSRYLSSKFNALGDTVTAFNNRKAKKLNLVENVDFAKQKYQELEVRSNLAFSRHPGSADTGLQDVASKYVIHKILQETGKASHQWRQADLLAELATRCRDDEQLASVLGHAIIKIRLFHDDAAVQGYLKRGALDASKKNHYSTQAKASGAQTPNEHLLMPEIENIIGVCVNFESVFGIDQALELNKTLRSEQKSLGIGKKDNPALLYQISVKKRKSISRAGWSQHIMPWSLKGLIDFAKTGKITGIDKRAFTPDHFKVIDLIAEAGALVAFEPEKQLSGCKMPQNFVGDLSTVKDKTENLLHVAIKANRSAEVIKFFYFWNVDAFEERDLSGDTVFDIAKRENHPCLEFLATARNWDRQSSEMHRIRDTYITERLHAIKTPRLSFDLRDGSSESGETAYIPELGSYRVVNGNLQLSKTGEFLHEGVQKYDADQAGMRFALGARTRKGKLDSIGIWQSDKTGHSPNPVLELGIQYSEARKTENGQAAPETIVLINNTGPVNHHIRFEIQSGTQPFAKVLVESGEIKEDRPLLMDTASASYFKINVFVPNEHLASFRECLKSKNLPIVNFRAMSVNRNFPARQRDIMIIKYVLASLRWLGAWKSKTPSFSQVESKYLAEHSAAFCSEVEHDFASQIQFLKDQIRGRRMGSVSQLVKPDCSSKSLLYHVADEICKVDDPNDADVNLLIAALLEDRRASSYTDLRKARDIYERLAQHGSGKAEYALARFHNEGLAGLQRDLSAGSACMRRAAGYGLVEAKDVLRAEAEQLAREQAQQHAAAELRLREARERELAEQARADALRLEMEQAAAIKAAKKPWKRFTHKVGQMLRSA